MHFPNDALRCVLHFKELLAHLFEDNKNLFSQNGIVFLQHAIVNPRFEKNSNKFDRYVCLWHPNVWQVRV